MSTSLSFRMCLLGDLVEGVGGGMFAHMTHLVARFWSLSLTS